MGKPPAHVTPPVDATAHAVFRSGLWIFGGSAGIRALQFVRTIVAARLLAPSGFGRFVLAAAILGVLEAVSHPGLEVAIVQARKVGDGLLRTAWTLRLLRGLALTAAVFLLAPVIASVAGEPDIAGFLRVLSLVGLMQSLTSLSLLLQVREANLVQTTRLQVGAETAETVVGIAVVAVTGSPWGLVIGRLSFGAVTLVGSYLIPGFVPALRLVREEFTSLFRFSRWIFLSNLFTYLSTSGDDVAVGAVAGARPLGLYRVAYRLANLPVFDLTQLAGQVALPALARLNERSPRHAAEVFHRYVVLSAGIAAPAAVLLAITAHDLIVVLVGPAWTGAATALSIIALAGFLRAVGATAETLFTALGKPQLTAAIHITRTVVLFASLALLLGPLGLNGAALATLIAAAVTVPVCVYGLSRVHIGPRSSGVAVLRRIPAAAGCGLAALVVERSLDGALLGLVLSASLGAAVWLMLVRLLDRPLRTELSLLLRGVRAAVAARRSSQGLTPPANQPDPREALL